MLPKKESVFLAVLLGGGCIFLGCQRGERSSYQPGTVSAVVSTHLAETEIVPTMDTPLAKSGSAVWCATFQVAWNGAREMIGDDPRIANAQPVADRLNASRVTEATLPPGSYYAAAGKVKDGIIETIHSEMARQFPGVEPPAFNRAAGFVTYAFLDTRATFTTPFEDTKRSIQFVAASGVTYSVRGFGLHEGTDWALREKQAAQVRVLFSQVDNERMAPPAAFALDLTADQADLQLIIAVLPRPEHLRAALNDLAQRIKNTSLDPHSAKLWETDTLAIPNVAFYVNHEFAELQGEDKIIENPGEFQDLYIGKAWESISFRLDKCGASVISESGLYAQAVPRQFVVDRPFLIVMKRRTANDPYFVAWIDNAELLEARREDNEGGS